MGGRDIRITKLLKQQLQSIKEREMFAIIRVGNVLDFSVYLVLPGALWSWG
jgi:uncharacterized protein YkvS